MFKLIVKWSKKLYICERGGGGDSEPAQPKTSQEIAGDTFAAQQQYNPQAAALEYSIQSQYAPLMQQLANQQREMTLPGGANTAATLQDVILQSLLSPTGLTSQQQSAQNAVRTEGVQSAQEAQRTRANLGGGLYGGRSAAAEQGDINNLINTYMTEDITRQEQQRQFAQTMAMNYLAQYLGIPIQSLNYISPAASPEAAMSSSTSAAASANQLAAQQSANKAAMMSSLFEALGKLGGSAILTGASGGAAA